MRIERVISPDKFPLKCYRLVDFIARYKMDKNGYLILDSAGRCVFTGEMQPQDNYYNWDGRPKMGFTMTEDELSGKVPYTRVVTLKDLRDIEKDIMKEEDSYCPEYPDMHTGRPRPGKEIDLGYVFSFMDLKPAAKICSEMNTFREQNGVPDRMRIYECEISGEDNECWTAVDVSWTSSSPWNSSSGRTQHAVMESVRHYVSNSVRYVRQVDEKYLADFTALNFPDRPVYREIDFSKLLKPQSIDDILGNL